MRLVSIVVICHDSRTRNLLLLLIGSVGGAKWEGVTVLEEGGGVKLAPWCLGGGGGISVIAPPPPSFCRRGNSLGNLGSINEVDFALWSIKNI